MPGKFPKIVRALASTPKVELGLNPSSPSLANNISCTVVQNVYTLSLLYHFLILKLIFIFNYKHRNNDNLSHITSVTARRIFKTQI